MLPAWSTAWGSTPAASVQKASWAASQILDDVSFVVAEHEQGGDAGPRGRPVPVRKSTLPEAPVAFLQPRRRSRFSSRKALDISTVTGAALRKLFKMSRSRRLANVEIRTS